MTLVGVHAIMIYVHDILQLMDTHVLSRVTTDVHVQLMRTVDLWDYLYGHWHCEPFLYEMLTVAPYVCTTWKGAWSLSLTVEVARLDLYESYLLNLHL